MKQPKKQREKNYIEISSNGFSHSTDVKVNGKKVKCLQIVRYKATAEEQAVSIVYLENSDGLIKTNSAGKVTERQYIFNQENAVFSLTVSNINGQVKLLVENNLPKIMVGEMLLEGIQEILWQVEAPDDLHEFEIKIL